MHHHLDPEFATPNGSIGSTPSVSPGQPLPPHPAKPITTPTLTTRKHPPSLHKGTKPKAVQSCRSRRPTNLRERSEAVVSSCRPSVSPHNALGHGARTLVEGRRMRRLEAQGGRISLCPGLGHGTWPNEEYGCSRALPRPTPAERSPLWTAQLKRAAGRKGTPRIVSSAALSSPDGLAESLALRRRVQPNDRTWHDVGIGLRRPFRRDPQNRLFGR